MKKLISILACGITLISAQVIEMSETQERDLGVKTQQISIVENISYGPYNGVVVIDKKDLISIGTSIEAVVENIYVKKFDSVKKGQKLLTISSTQLLNLQNDYIEALINSQLIDENYERDLKLKEEGIISEKKLLLSQKEKRSSDLQVKLSRNYLLANNLNSSLIKKIQNSHMPITSITIYSPRDAIINEINANIGEVVDASKSIMSLYAHGDRFIELSVPVKDVDSISVGDRCQFSNFNATVTTISNILNKNSSSVELRAKIIQAKNIMINRVYPVSIFKSIVNSVKVKKSALVYEGEKAYVFKKVQKGYEPLEVKILKEGPTCYILNANLKESDSVAVSSTSALLNAMESEDE